MSARRKHPNDLPVRKSTRSQDDQHHAAHETINPSLPANGTLDRDIKQEVEDTPLEQPKPSYERESSEGRRRSMRLSKPSAKALEASQSTLKDVKLEEEDDEESSGDEYIPEKSEADGRRLSPCLSSAVPPPQKARIITRCSPKLVVHSHMRKPYGVVSAVAPNSTDSRKRPLNRLADKQYNSAITPVHQAYVRPSLDEKILSVATEQKVAQIREANVQKILEKRSHGEFVSGTQAAAHEQEISTYVATVGQAPPRLRVIVPKNALNSKPNIIGRTVSPTFFKYPKFVVKQGIQKPRVTVSPVKVINGMRIARIPKGFRLTRVQKEKSPEKSPEKKPSPDQLLKEPKQEIEDCPMPLEETKPATMETPMELEERKPELMDKPAEVARPPVEASQPTQSATRAFSSLPMIMDRKTNQLFVRVTNGLPDISKAAKPVVHRQFRVVNTLTTPTPRGSQCTTRTVTVIPEMYTNKDGTPPGTSTSASTSVSPPSSPPKKILHQILVPTRKFANEVQRRPVHYKRSLPKLVDAIRTDHSYCVAKQNSAMDNEETSDASEEPPAKKMARLKWPSYDKLPKKGSKTIDDVVAEPEEIDPFEFTDSDDSSRSETPEVRERSDPPKVYLGPWEPMKDFDEKEYGFKRMTIKTVKKFTPKMLRPFGKRPPGMGDAPVGAGLSNVALSEDEEEYMQDKEVEDDEERVEEKRRREWHEKEKLRQKEAWEDFSRESEEVCWQNMQSRDYLKTVKPVSDMTPFEKILQQPNALAKIPAYSESLSHNKPKLYNDLTRVQKILSKDNPEQEKVPQAEKRFYPVRTYKKRGLTSTKQGRLSGPVRGEVRKSAGSPSSDKSESTRKFTASLLKVIWNGEATTVPDRIQCHRCHYVMRLLMRRTKYRGQIREYPAYRCLRKGCQTFRSIKNYIEGAPAGSRRSRQTKEEQKALLKVLPKSSTVRSERARRSSRLEKMSKDYVVDSSTSEIARKDADEDSQDEDEELLEWSTIKGTTPSSSESPFQGQSRATSQRSDSSEHHKSSCTMDVLSQRNPQREFEFEEEEDQIPPVMVRSKNEKEEAKKIKEEEIDPEAVGECSSEKEPKPEPMEETKPSSLLDN